MSEESTAPAPRARPADDMNRRLRFITCFAFGAVLLLAIGLLAWPDSDGEDSAARFVEPESGIAAEDYGPYDDPGDDGDIEIVEKGYTPIKDLAGDDQVSWGAIIANSSELSVAQVKLELRILDSEGESLNQEAGDYALDPVVETVFPGEETGIGDVIYMDGPGAEKFELQVDSVDWWPLDDPDTHFEEMTVSEISTEWINQGESVPYWSEDELGSYMDERGELRIDFRLDSPYDEMVEPGAAAVFRDEDGEIVGGSPPNDTDSHAVAPPGRSQQNITVEYGPPEDIDEDAIEVYAYAWAT